MHATESIIDPSPSLCESTCNDDVPPISVCRASSLCDGSRHERQRQGGATTPRYAYRSSLSNWDLNWHVCTDGQRCIDLGVRRRRDTDELTVDHRRRWPIRASGAATSRLGEALGADARVSFFSVASTTLDVISSGGRTGDAK